MSKRTSNGVTTSRVAAIPPPEPATAAPKRNNRPAIRVEYNENGWGYFVKPNGQIAGLSKSNNKINVNNYLHKLVTFGNSRVGGKTGCSKVQLAALKRVAAYSLSFAMNDIANNLVHVKETNAKPLAPYGSGASREVYSDLMLATCLETLRIPHCMVPTILDSAQLAVATTAGDNE